MYGYFGVAAIGSTRSTPGPPRTESQTSEAQHTRNHRSRGFTAVDVMFDPWIEGAPVLEPKSPSAPNTRSASDYVNVGIAYPDTSRPSVDPAFAVSLGIDARTIARWMNITSPLCSY